MPWRNRFLIVEKRAKPLGWFGLVISTNINVEEEGERDPESTGNEEKIKNIFSRS
jgi:hypothetical protein